MSRDLDDVHAAPGRGRGARRLADALRRAARALPHRRLRHRPARWWPGSARPRRRRTTTPTSTCATAGSASGSPATTPTASPAATSPWRARSATIAAEEGATADPSLVQVVEIALDTWDAAQVKPFWRAVLAFDDSGDDLELVDAVGSASTALVPAHRRARRAAAAVPPRRPGAARAGRGEGGRCPGRRRHPGQRRARPDVLGAGRPAGQQGLRDHLARSRRRRLTGRAPGRE